MNTTNNRNKYLLAGLVVLALIGYSVHQRQEGAKVAQTPIGGSSSSSLSAGTTGSPSGTSSGSGSQPAVSYRDGQYTGTQADAYYGYIQVKVTISRGKISDVSFLQYPNDQRNSIEINQQAMPLLRQEALQAQSAKVDVVSGATDTSQAFEQSLSSALSQAQA